MKREIIYYAILVFVAATLIFGCILYLPIGTDIQYHAKFTREVGEGQSPPPPKFLYHLIIYGFVIFGPIKTPSSWLLYRYYPWRW